MRDNLQYYYLQQMGIEVWEVRKSKFGNLLEQMLANIGLTCTDVLILNDLQYQLINRTYKPLSPVDINTSDASASHAWLSEKIQAVEPQLILAFSPIPTSKSFKPIIQKYQDIPVLLSFHPTHLLNNPLDKKKAYISLIAVHDLIKKHSCSNS